MKAGPKAAVDPTVLPFRPQSTGAARFAKFCERDISGYFTRDISGVSQGRAGYAGRTCTFKGDASPQCGGRARAECVAARSALPRNGPSNLTGVNRSAAPDGPAQTSLSTRRARPTRCARRRKSTSEEAGDRHVPQRRDVVRCPLVQPLFPGGTGCSGQVAGVSVKTGWSAGSGSLRK
jgi:hypothetical protein